jgi:predicted component of type VI protein secretion system
MLAHLRENTKYPSAFDRDDATMNYVLQVVRGRSATTTLKLADGVTSLGRHDDCIIRIKSSQVSRKHCELFEAGGKLTVRDLGSSNGTFVNGKRVLGQQPLKVGDELTVGSVTLRVATLGQPVAAATPHTPAGKPGDTAVVEAVAIEADEEEFEIEFDEGPTVDPDAIPLADVDEAPAAPPAPKKADAAPAAAPKAPAAEKATAKPAAGKGKGEDEAVAQFLLDLDLDDE